MVCKHGEPLRFLGGNICIKETEIMIEKKFVFDFTLNSDACHKALTWSYSCDTCSCSHEGDVSTIYRKLRLGPLRSRGLIFVVKAGSSSLVIYQAGCQTRITTYYIAYFTYNYSRNYTQRSKKGHLSCKI